MITTQTNRFETVPFQEVGAKSFEKKKIMLVDDVEISNFIMKKMISKVSPEFEVYDFTLPETAFTEIDNINPDIIFLDLNMPVINGWEFLSKMNSSNRQNTVYILTSSTSECDLHECRNYQNVKDFLVKPLNIAVLDNILNEEAA